MSQYQVEVGVQQRIGQWVVVDVGYFDKGDAERLRLQRALQYADPFPVAWDHSHINGVTGRVDLVGYHGVRAFVVMGHPSTSH